MILQELCIPIVQALSKNTSYVVRMAPYGVDARLYSRAEWGGRIDIVFPIEKSDNILAVTSGLEKEDLSRVMIFPWELISIFPILFP